jgi:hypothetical protein
MAPSQAPNKPNTSNADTSSFAAKIADGNLEVIYCPTEMMWADVLTKPKQGKPFRLNRSHLMNIPFNYDDNVERTNTHPLLLPQDESPKLSPKQMNDQLYKTPIIHPRSVLGTERPSLTKPVPGTRPLPITQRLDFPNRSLTQADQTRIPIATE